MLAHARHFPTQLPVLGALGRVALVSARQQALDRVSRQPTPPASIPGPILTAEVPLRPRQLIRDYLRHVGGDPAAYRVSVPPHLFPQWTFPLQMRALEGIGYPAAQILNAGCRLTLNRAIPDDEPLRVSVQLTGIDDDGRRAVINQRVITGTRRAPEALVADWQGIVRLARGKSPKPKDNKNEVPADARPIDYWRLSGRIGLQFALLTGDFNPVHWIPVYARLMGFRGQIVHGFSSLARTMESVIRVLANGDPARLESFACRFTRPLVLPAEVVLYRDEAGGLFVGDAPASPAYLSGSYALRQERRPRPSKTAKGSTR